MGLESWNDLPDSTHVVWRNGKKKGSSPKEQLRKEEFETWADQSSDQKQKKQEKVQWPKSLSGMTRARVFSEGQPCEGKGGGPL